MKSNHEKALVFLAPFFLYGAVLSGLYIFRSGWAAMVGYHIAICVILTISKSWKTVIDIFKGWNWFWGISTSAVCLCSGALIFILWPWAHHDHLTMREALESLGLEGWVWFSFILYYSLINPFFEEVFWRAWYPKKLKTPILADILFAGYHVFVLVLFLKLIWVVIAFGSLIVAARFWRFLMDRYKGLLVPFTSHLAADISVIVAASLLALWPDLFVF